MGTHMEKVGELPVMRHFVIMQQRTFHAPADERSRTTRRCLAKDPAHFAERNKQKLDLGLIA